MTFLCHKICCIKCLAFFCFTKIITAIFSLDLFAGLFLIFLSNINHVNCQINETTLATTPPRGQDDIIKLATEPQMTAVVSEITIIESSTAKIALNETIKSNNADLNETEIVAATTTQLPEITIFTTSVPTTIVESLKFSSPNEDRSTNDQTTTIESLCSMKNADNLNSGDNDYSIETTNGDIIVTIILAKNDNISSTILFLVNHLNEIDLLSYNTTIGKRLLDFF